MPNPGVRETQGSVKGKLQTFQTGKRGNSLLAQDSTLLSVCLVLGYVPRDIDFQGLARALALNHPRKKVFGSVFVYKLGIVCVNNLDGWI